MLENYVSRSKLMAYLAGGLALFASAPATTGVLFTVKVMEDFVITENASLDYHPPLEEVNRIAESEAFFAPSEEYDKVGLYLKNGELNDGSSALRFEILAEADTEPLLGGVLESMHSDQDAGSFDFLVNNDGISGKLAMQYSGQGLAVRVAGLERQHWLGVYSSLASNPEASRLRAAVGPSASGVPAAPAPGTLALLLAAAIPLLTSRRRG